MMKDVKAEDLPLQKYIYNSRIIDAYMAFLDETYPDIDQNKLLSFANMTNYEVEDHGHWFTQEQVDRFYEYVLQKTGDTNIAEKAGRFMASSKVKNEVVYYFISLLGITNAYKTVSKGARSMTKAEDYTTAVLGKNRVEIVVTPRDGVQEKEYQCLNRKGMLEAVGELYNAVNLRVEHPECIFKGDSKCKYSITWSDSKSQFLKRIMHISIPVLVLGNLLVYLQNGSIPDTVISLLLSSILALFLKTLSLKEEKNEIEALFRNIYRSPEKWIEQIEMNYNNSLLNYEIGQIINNHTNINDVLDSVVQVSEKRLNYDRGAIFLADKEGIFLEFKAGFGYFERDKILLKKTRFHLKRPDSRGIFVVSFREKRPFLINDVDNIEQDLSKRSLEFAKQLGSQSFICCPIMYENKSLGIIVADNIRSKRKLHQSDLSLYMGIASAVGMALKTAELFEDKEKQFQSTLRILASSIDARDPLTAGHSEKVTEYAVAICGLLELDSDTTEMIRLAALFHDYGKIAIPDSILKKEGPLSSDEYLSIQSHAVKTREILEEISFEGIYRDVPIIAGSHHEKMDGSGYPGRLKGKDIPLGSRIIAVADYFEALTAKRHYRDPMIVDEAIAELRKASGNHLDKEIVDVFIPYIQTTLGSGSERIVSA